MTSTAPQIILVGNLLYWPQTITTGFPASTYIGLPIISWIDILDIFSDDTTSTATTIEFHQRWEEILQNLATRLSNHVTSMIY